MCSNVSVSSETHVKIFTGLYVVFPPHSQHEGGSISISMSFPLVDGVECYEYDAQKTGRDVRGQFPVSQWY
jgi:hypothetical protein